MADLKTYDLFNADALRTIILEHGREHKFKKGECFCRMECTAKEIGLVRNGVFGFSRPDGAGRDQILSLASTGEFVGAVISLYPTRRSAFDVTALCTSTVVSMPITGAFALAEELQPGFRSEFTEAIAYGFMMRGISFRCDKPEERYVELVARIPNICDVISMSAIASYLGLSREAFARLRGRMKNCL